MKTFFLVSIFISSLFYSCSNDDDKINNDNSIIGTWKLEASVIGTGSIEIINPIENGQTINFNNDGVFSIINSNIECSEGVYTIIENSEQHFNSDVIILNCNNQNTYEYSYSIENKKLYLTFLLEDGSSGCDEICAERYTQITEE